LCGKPEGKSPLGGSKRKWKSNIRMEEWELNSSGLGWEPVAGFCERGNGLYGSMIFSARILHLGDMCPSQPLKSKLHGHI